MALNIPEQKTERALGDSDTKTLSEMFAATPTDFDPKMFQDDLLDGVQSGNPDLGSFSMDYADAPGIDDFAPNPSSPGPGDVNPQNKPPAPAKWPPPASGFGSQTQPKDTSPKIAKQKSDQLIPGASSEVC